MTSGQPVRVLIVDDHPVYRRGLRAVLDLEEDIETVADARDGSEAYQKVIEFSPDVVLMDVRMRGMDGPEATRRIRADHPSVQVIALSGYEDQDCIVEMVKAGVVGYVLKDSEPGELVRAIRQVVKGYSQLDPSVARKILNSLAQLAPPYHAARVDQNDLSNREIEVLRCVALGSSNDDIAHELFISEHTVENHIRNIYQKLHIRDRRQATLCALKLGIIRFSDDLS